MQPQIQPTLAAQGSDTQPTPSLHVTDVEAAPGGNTANATRPMPFWRGVIAASIVVLVISVILAGILMILPAAH
ncbi:MAG: hypothetical protein H0X24_14885 [Ktedonobacterales bacterium]|nr:hypothetical protein [Ktedonobacterales bacterium]